MAREGISYEEVATVCDRMRAAGERPTIRTVLAALGRGSPNTIHNHLKKWKEARPAQRIEESSALPPDIARSILAELQRQRAEAVAELEQQLVDARVETDALAADGQRQEARIEELETIVAALTSERDTFAGRFAEAQQEVQRLTDEIERERQAAETARIETAQARLKVEAQAELTTHLSYEVEQLTAQLLTEREVRQQAQTTAAVAETQAKELREQLAKSEERIAEVKATGAETLQEARKRAADEIHRAIEKLQQRETELTEARNEAKIAAAQLVEALQRQVDTQKKPDVPPKK